MTTIVKVIANHGWPVRVAAIDLSGRIALPAVRIERGETRDFHVHSGQDLHIHEIQPAEVEAATSDTPSHSGLPVAGYRPQSSDAVARANAIKRIEERALRLLDELKADPEIDQRWLATGRTDIEKGFSCVVRSIFKLDRVELSE